MSVIDEIKARLDIVDVVSSYISLKKSGRVYKSPCPFHSERTPSFIVFPDSQSWRCFGACNEGGDIFSFVKKMDGLDFREVLQLLAERAGVELQPHTPESRAQQDADERLHQLLDTAAAYYLDLLLTSPAAQATRTYVSEKRGLTDETIQAFQLGYALDQWDNALNHFRRCGYTRDEVVAAGLAIENDQGRVYDRFRNRLMIPIRDARGRTVGFGARALAADQEPKYLNSPQGVLFDKSRLLYGFDLARRAIRETETVIVVEGYMDTIQAHQAGYTNVVAQMGTALTETQVRQLAKYVHRLILALDTDAAGMRATMRGLDVVRESLAEAGTEVKTVFDARSMLRTAGKLSLDVRVLRLPAGKDPDEFIRATPEQWPEVVENAQPLVDYVIDAGTQSLKAGATISEREIVARNLLPLLTATENNLYRHENIQRLAIRLRIPEDTLLGWLPRQNGEAARPVPRARPGNRRYSNEPAAPAVPIKSLRQSGAAIERYCLAVLLQQPDRLFKAQRIFRTLATQDLVAAPLLNTLNVQDFSGEDLRVVFGLIESASYDGDGASLDFVKQAAPIELIPLIDDVAREGRLEEYFQQNGSRMHNTELASIIREQHRFEDEIDREADAFLLATLKLRLERLKRERNERFFSVNMPDSPEEELEHNDDHIIMYARAQKVLEQAMQNLTHRRQRQESF